MLFHELLHRLLAVQKAVMLQRGDRRELADVVRIDGQLPGGCYRRAWQIVDEADAYQHYVRELRR